MTPIVSGVKITADEVTETWRYRGDREVDCDRGAEGIWTIRDVPARFQVYDDFYQWRRRTRGNQPEVLGADVDAAAGGARSAQPGQGCGLGLGQEREVCGQVRNRVGMHTHAMTLARRSGGLIDIVRVSAPGPRSNLRRTEAAMVKAALVVLLCGVGMRRARGRSSNRRRIR